jgi:hypothetical protein
MHNRATGEHIIMGGNDVNLSLGRPGVAPV